MCHCGARLVETCDEAGEAPGQGGSRGECHGPSLRENQRQAQALLVKDPHDGETCAPPTPMFSATRCEKDSARARAQVSNHSVTTVSRPVSGVDSTRGYAFSAVMTERGMRGLARSGPGGPRAGREPNVSSGSWRTFHDRAWIGARIEPEGTVPRPIDSAGCTTIALRGQQRVPERREEQLIDPRASEETPCSARILAVAAGRRRATLNRYRFSCRPRRGRPDAAPIVSRTAGSVMCKTVGLQERDVAVWRANFMSAW